MPDAGGGVPAVVLLAGAGDTVASWALVRELIDPDTRVIAVERQGLVERAWGPRSLDAYLAELDALVAGEDAPVVLVGHSFGGLLAQVYAERHPERVAGLLLVDATPRAVAFDRGVAAGFAVSAGIARLLRALAPLGLVRLLLAARALPLYPEQRSFERRADGDTVRAWKDTVDRAMRGGAADELRSVLPATREATELDGESLLRDARVCLITSSAYGAAWVTMHDKMAARYPLERPSVHAGPAPQHSDGASRARRRRDT